MESIYVKNFRSILDSGEIQISPLTIMVGKNSAGKSSIVRLFPLLKQSMERNISAPLLWFGDYVDFGDFEDVVSRNNIKSPIELGFSLYTYGNRFGFYSVQYKKQEILVNVKLSINKDRIEKIQINFFDQEIVLYINDKNEVLIEINGDSSVFADKQLIAFKDNRSIIPVICEKENKDDYLRRLDLSNIVESVYKILEIKQSKKNDSKYYYGDALDIPIGSKKAILDSLRKKNSNKFNKYKINHIRFKNLNNKIIALKLKDIFDRINYSFYDEIKATSYLKPIRANVNRYYRNQGFSIRELDSDGGNLPMILNSLTKIDLKKFESWSKEKFGVVFSVKPSEGHISLVIKNEVDGDIETNVADTGYGYSQMLPIVMLLWMIHSGYQLNSRNISIVIEQPELHLHPAFQAKMIDVFINVIKELKKNNINLKVILESHSETMINRIGRLIYQDKISADDVSIYIFDKDNDITTISKKQFNEKGLLKGWPIGFFSIDED